MFGASFGIISQALDIYRKSLDIRNRNIINANNPDYVEEEPVVKSFAPVGIFFEEVRRDQNIFYLSLRNDKISLVKYLEERSGVLSNVEGIFQELFEGTGINEYVNRFFSAYQDLMKDPTNDGARFELVNSARSLVDFMKAKSRDMDKLDQSLKFNTSRIVKRINELSRKLYVLNQEITVIYAQTYARGKDYKNLLDERDKYLRELSELINVDVQQDEIGRVKIFTSRGFALVDFVDNYWELEFSGDRIYWKSEDGNSVDITDILQSGKIKAMIDGRADLQRFKGEIDAVAKYLISTVKIPRNDSGTWYLIPNVEDNTVPLSTYGLDGNLEFYDDSTSPPTLISTIANYGSLSLDGLAAAINSDPALASAGITATVVTNPDGTYTLRIDSTNPAHRIADSGNNFFESSPVFTGNDLATMETVSTLSSDVTDLDYSLTDTFSEFSNGWWNTSRDLVHNLINDISTTQADVKDKLRIESALLESIDRKLQEMQGVSIDKEFMEIMRIQRTYDAVAKVVTKIDELLQTTLNMV
jgi:flagellar hook-associated protein 1 FlgK